MVAHDFGAAEPVSATPSIYRVGWLARLPLKTPYPAAIARIQSIMSRLPQGTDLVVDFGGVGRGIYDGSMTWWL